MAAKLKLNQMCGCANKDEISDGMEQQILLNAQKTFYFIAWVYVCGFFIAF